MRARGGPAQLAAAEQAAVAFRRTQPALSRQACRTARSSDQQPLLDDCLAREQPAVHCTSAAANSGTQAKGSPKACAPSMKWIQITLGIGQLVVKPAFPDTQHREHDPLGPQPLHDAVEHESGRRQGVSPLPRYLGQCGDPGRRKLQDSLCERAHCIRWQGVAITTCTGAPAARWTRAKRAPATAHGIEGRAIQLRRDGIPQQRVDPRLRSRNACLKQCPDRQRTEGRLIRRVPTQSSRTSAISRLPPPISPMSPIGR